MTWEQLLNLLMSNLHISELKDTATIYIPSSDEYYSIESYGRCDDGVLDDKHFFLKSHDSDEGIACTLT